MDWLRKIDWWLQVAIVICVIFAAPIIGGFTIFYGQIILGCIQLISGGFHFLTQLPALFRRGIIRYWTFVLLYLFICLLLGLLNNEILRHSKITLIIFFLIIPLMLSFYYLHWYRKLINYLSFHRELAGLIKS